jgi:hypothetical protein
MQVYDFGAVPRFRAALAALDDLSAVRLRAARLRGARSHAEQLAAGEGALPPGALLAALQEAAEELAPSAAAVLSSVGAASTADAAAAALRAAPAVPSSDAYADYMHLPTVLEGVCGLLAARTGVQLALASLAPGEAWGPDILKLSASRGGQHMGCVYIDAGGGYYGTRVLRLRGGSSGEGGAAVAVGLSSRGVLAGAGLTAGVWELAHEMGHAVHHLVSATGIGAAPPACVGMTPQPAEGASSSAAPWQPYHFHALWAPLELQELPAHAAELLCTRPGPLTAACRHRATGAPLPAAMAAALAAAIEHAWYCPLSYQQQVLTLLLDALLACADGGGGPPAAALAAQLWADLSPAGAPFATFQQLRSLPRIAADRGRAGGYVLARLAATQLEATGGLRGVPPATALGD